MNLFDLFLIVAYWMLNVKQMEDYVYFLKYNKIVFQFEKKNYIYQ